MKIVSSLAINDRDLVLRILPSLVMDTPSFPVEQTASPSPRQLVKPMEVARIHTKSKHPGKDLATRFLEFFKDASILRKIRTTHCRLYEVD